LLVITGILIFCPRRWFEKALRSWPLLTSTGVGLLNMEVVVIPFILIGYFDLWDVELKIAAICWATGELVYWFWFSGWLEKTSGGKRVIEVIKGARKFGEDIIFPKAEEINIVETTKEWVDGQVNKFNPNQYKDKRIFRFVKKHGKKTAKGTGKILAGGLLVAVAAVPTPILWIPALVACRAVKWKTGFFCMMIGNAIKNWIFCNAWMYLLTQI
jgi:hypothetical protein